MPALRRHYGPLPKFNIVMDSCKSMNAPDVRGYGGG